MMQMAPYDTFDRSQLVQQLESKEMQRSRSRTVLRVERMLKTHRPHEVLTDVPDNFNWKSKTFQLAWKIERILFLVAKSHQGYVDITEEKSLRHRVELIARHLIRLRRQRRLAHGRK